MDVDQVQHSGTFWSDKVDGSMGNLVLVLELHTRQNYSNYFAHSEPLLKELNLLKVKDLFELKILKFLFKLYHNNLPSYFNSYRSHLARIVTPYTLRPHPLPVPRLSHVFAEAGLLYKLVVIKKKFAASDEVISFRINDQSYSLIGFNQYVIEKMVDNYSYVGVLNH